MALGGQAALRGWARRCAASGAGPVNRHVSHCCHGDLIAPGASVASDYTEPEGQRLLGSRL